jgi:type VI secretion system protein ImpM
MSAAEAVAGFCGKLPIRADFVTRRVPLAWVEPWHDWLAEVMSATRTALGEDWLDAYLYGPIWRFALPAGVVGAGAVAGILMPSVDAVGRYFPLTIVLPSPSAAALAGAVIAGSAWFADAEELSLALVAPSSTAAETRTPGTPLPGSVLSFDPEKDPADTLRAAQVPAQLAAGNSLWWTIGSERVPAVMLIAAGLPTPAGFAGMLDGRWAAHGWRAVDADALHRAASLE